MARMKPAYGKQNVLQGVGDARNHIASNDVMARQIIRHNRSGVMSLVSARLVWG